MQDSWSDPQNLISGVWWCTPTTPALGRLKQGDLQFRIVLGYSESLEPRWDTGDPASKEKGRKLTV